MIRFCRIAAVIEWILGPIFAMMFFLGIAHSWVALLDGCIIVVIGFVMWFVADTFADVKAAREMIGK